ncbi:MAG TPA: LytR C-terminal domain-containing protein [Nocardioides sp.]|uniref:LytR C-terminal domain-containing protein n=1 Tax=Nocardioides sp. TaxID=35761 RepID=UPI002E34E854|nr:LytR C-terminal domain-containing protein [Nocardioides sp.]HEX5089596.1 LytR C-terminal domain-containing protein [Nocardioides sp.]
MREWQLTARLRTAITLAALLLLMLLGITWGWAQVLKPFPGKVDAPICVDTTYRTGDELSVQDVTVSVFNASAREGLAARTLQQLEDAGFSGGETANAPKGTALSGPAEIWVKKPDDPGVKLLRKRVGKVPVVEHPENTAAGITLVVGDQFGDLQDGPDSVVLTDDAVVCSPPVD